MQERENVHPVRGCSGSYFSPLALIFPLGASDNLRQFIKKYDNMEGRLTASPAQHNY